MKTLIFLLMFSPLLYSQQTTQQSGTVPGEQELVAPQSVSAAEHQRVKDLLIDYVGHCNTLEKENSNLKQVLTQVQTMATELSKVKTLDELDKVLGKYGITRDKNNERDS